MDEFSNDGILKLNGKNLHCQNRVYKMFCERTTEWQARKVRDDLRSNGYKTVITENKERHVHIVWWTS